MKTLHNSGKSLVLICVLVFAPFALADDFASRICCEPSCGCDSASPLDGAVAQDTGGMQGMSGMQHNGAHSMNQMDMNHPTTFIEEILAHSTAGTSAEPISTLHDMLMTEKGAWMLMFHGVAFAGAQQQTGPRGGDKVIGTSWFMPMAQRSLGPGTFTARVMLSLDPATITNRRYPELFQIGETAFGKPIVDGQHPHDFFMELALLYDISLGKNALLSFYGAPVGDPAMGPEAYAHRVSASEDTLAPLAHHLQDSTHIASDVMTAGLTYKIARVEVSGFHGREPDENRWNIDAGAIDSWSARLTLIPAANWSGQYSIARLKSPEQLFPNGDTLRMTASVMYNRPLHRERAPDWGNWATTLLWGRNREIPDGEIFNSYLAESTVRFAKHNFAWTRIENVDRTNELLLGENPVPPEFDEHFLARIQAYSFGYDREFDFIPHIASAFGAQYTLYGKPAARDARNPRLPSRCPEMARTHSNGPNWPQLLGFLM
ncbi:MAG: hypothetical protein WBP79_11005 [Candidatus Acidiferrales bacterium]